MKNHNATAFALLIILLLSAAPALFAANRLELPQGVYYHRFAASVEGTEASWINPAVLGFSRGVAGQLTGEIYDGKFAKNWGFSTVGDGVGISYRHLDDLGGEEYNEYIFGSGFRVGYGSYVGASYRYIKDGPENLDGSHFWNIGLLFRQNPKISLALVLSNLNRENIDGEKTDIDQLYSLTYRPLGRHFNFSAETSLSAKQNLSSAVYNYGFELFPIDGVMGYFNFDTDENYELGFRINLTRYFVGLQSRLATGGVHRGTSLTAGISSDPQSSVIRPPGMIRH